MQDNTRTKQMHPLTMRFKSGKTKSERKQVKR